MICGKFIPWLLQAILVFLFSECATPLTSNNTDRLALIAFKHQITSDPFQSLASWNHSLHLCQWTGVSCGSRHWRVTGLDLSQLNLTGTLSPHIANLTFLRDLYLQDNLLHGGIPMEIGGLVRLQRLNLSNNLFCGEIPLNLTHCSSLKTLRLDDNNLIGEIPPQLGFLSSLVEVSLGLNYLKGEIPPQLVSLSSLEVLGLHSNYLKGEIPPHIANLTFLRDLYLQDNSLHGGIPMEIGGLVRLQRLNLSWNSFDGEIPPQLGFLSSLVELNLGYNNLSREIPPLLGSLSSLVDLRLHSNNLTGEIPPQLGSMSSLVRLSLGNNYLTGEIPPQLCSLSSLVVLTLGNNNLTGEIPPQFGSLSTIQVLDMSFNRLSGPIPEYLETFVRLQVLDLSFNDFEGEVPQKGIFKNTTATIIHGNDKLCGGIQELSLPACPNQPVKKSRSLEKNKPLKDINIFAIKLVTPLVIGVLICAIALSCFYHRIKKSRETHYIMPLETQYPQVSYKELMKATDGFSPANLIGVGSYGFVYRGFLGLDEEIVAIKVFNLKKRGASKSFLAECKALRNIRHRNLVNIITACSSIDLKGQEFKALVFNYIPNGTLENWLHPKGDYHYLMRSLTFVERLNIAIDIATALEYLHCHCHTPIVHCDLKPCNVLLDSDMTALVGDFGLARFLSKAIANFSHGSASSSRIKGTIGYIPPEYGITGKVSTRGDVYSYGILLLEMFTGKIPTHEMFKDGMSLHRHSKMSLPNHVKDILDPHLLLEEKVPPKVGVRQNCTRNKMCECAASIIKIAVSCSNEHPKDRMLMNDIIKEMHMIRDRLMEVDSQKELRSIPHLLEEESPSTS